MPKLGLGLSLPQTIASGGFTPKKLSGLSLWLKADAGVSRFSYNYTSQIVISGTSTPNFNGTYTAIGIPAYGNEYPGIVDTYSLSGPSGRVMFWDSYEQQYRVFLDGSGNTGGFASSDGVTWGPVEDYFDSITITGFTGIYAGANGTYQETYFGSGRYEASGQYFIQNGELKYTETEDVIATNNNNYTGAWSPGSYDSTVIVAGAGSTSANGTYTRPDTLDFRSTFYASGGRTISYAADWFIGDLYNAGSIYGPWYILNGDPDVPTTTVQTSTRSVGAPTSTSVYVPSGSISGSVTTSTVTTGTVITWTDQSQYNHVLSSSVAGQNNPKLVNSFVNGKPVVEFTRDNNEGLSHDGVLLESTFTFFSVTKQKSTNGPGRTFSSYYNNFLIGTWGTEPTAYSNRFFGGDDNGWLVEGENISTDWLITTAYAGSSNSFYFNQNGGTPVTGTSQYSLIIDGVSVGGGVANAGGFSEPSDSYIAEIIIYDRVLTTEERQQVEAYLNTKYAIY